jgi:hypothetical protein
MKEMIEELVAEVKVEPGKWEEVVQEVAYGLARQVAVALLKRLDDGLMEERGEGLRAVGCRGRWVTTLFGDIWVKRRVYRDEGGRYRCLMDEAIGLRKRCQSSSRLEALATYLSTHLPFGKCEEVLRALVPGGVSHTTIHRLVGRVVDAWLAEEAKEVAEVFDEGVVPESEGRVVSHLLVEGDGVNISLQREEERRAEIKVAIAYEGWEPIGKDRYRLKEKTTYAGMMPGRELWESFSVLLAKRYDLGKVERVIVGGDGSEWVKEGAEMLGGIYQLDRFHLLRALRRGLRDDQVGPVYEACVVGDIAKADELLKQAQAEVKGDAAKRISELRGYILNNADGLRDYRLEVGYQEGLRGLGTIESNIDKLVASRMKKRGMSWTKPGGDRMARLINLRERGELHLWVNSVHQPEVCEKTGPRFKLRPESDKPSQDKYRVWLEAGVPVLYGPHHNHPWAQALAAITHETKSITRLLSGIAPTRS